jgi:N6-L-threonylcarbamoyladenine synthase
MRVLGIETSCDETAAAVVEDGHKLLSNAVASSMDMQAKYGGVVPEIAARSHIESISPLSSSKHSWMLHATWDDIDA